MSKKGEASTSSASKLKSKPRILAVDYELDITTILKKGLEQHGFQVTTSNDSAGIAASYKRNSYGTTFCSSTSACPR